MNDHLYILAHEDVDRDRDTMPLPPGYAVYSIRYRSIWLKPKYDGLWEGHLKLTLCQHCIRLHGGGCMCDA